ncbi:MULTISPECIES: ArsR/SmtB family transcription factor [Bacteria]|uniref:Transcriptional repressor n=1 Tax=Bacillus cereus VD184 TaxID=1053242 RepID=A0A9W5VV31_BACCE|nr:MULTISPECIES: metalloregulator ArsR/SmtB family transcription factor [Bacteria]EOQ19564.1 transcriptional repressor [Bacillus cereus VD184]MDQ4680078.1 metalloregulator ArsR/SmtB family transcription factor [Stenotrophomonas maltophilia group sp. RNC7]
MQRFVTLETNSMEIQENVDTIKVMAHPVRLKILYELYKNKTLNVTQLTETLNIPQSTVSQHLAKMKGIILKGDRKGLEIYYSIHNNKANELVKLLCITD